MRSDVERVTEALFSMVTEDVYTDGRRGDGSLYVDGVVDLTAAAQAVVHLLRPQVVTTDELNALPPLTAVVSSGSDPVVAQKSPGGQWCAVGGLSVVQPGHMRLLSPWTVVWSPPVESGETQGGEPR